MYHPRINTMLLTLILMIGLVYQPAAAGVASPAPSTTQATGSEIWLAAYDGPDKQADTGNSVAVDNAGNTYVAGTSDGYNSNDKNIVVIKYGPSGQVIWNKIYNGPGRSDGYNIDQAVEIDVDEQGYVYVVGNSVSETNMDIVTLRYRPDGALDWEQRYNGPATDLGNQVENANSMSVTDDAIYVSGTSYDDSSAILVLLKYSKSGEFQWERHYAAEGPSFLAIGGDGSIYQAGGVYSQLLSVYHFVLVKYQPDGTRVWDKLYHQDDPYSNDAAGIQVDFQENIIVGGTFERQANFGTATDAGLIKFDPSGNILWDRRIVDPNQQNTLDVFGFSVDSSGSSYLFTTGLYIFKYDGTGNQAWMIHSEELSVPTINKAVLKCGSDQSLYITSAYGVMKFGSSGNVLLSYQHGTDPFDGLFPANFAIGPDSSIAITGMVHANSEDMLTAKYPGNPGIYLTVEDALTSEGNRPNDNRTADFVVRLSKSLTYSVSFKYQTVDLSAHAGSDYVETEGLGWIDPGRPWTTISVPILADTNSEANKQFQLQILTADGVVIVNDRATATILDDDFDLVAWSKSMPTPGSNSSDLFDLKTDSQGNGYIRFAAGVTSFDPAGNPRWTKAYQGDTNAMQVDSHDNIYLAGMDPSKRLVTRKLDALGNLIWEQFYTDLTKGDHRGATIAVDPQGNIIVGGIVPYQTSADTFYDTLVLKYSSNGDLLWARQLHVQGVETSSPTAAFTDAAGNITIVGIATNPVSVVLMAKYASNGDLLWDGLYAYHGYPQHIFSQAQYDSHSNLFLSFIASNISDQIGVVVKVTPDGQIAWEIPCGFAGCGLPQFLNNLGMDPFGNLIETITSGTSALVIKIKDNLNYVWRFEYPNLYVEPRQAASDGEGFTYVTGGQNTIGVGNMLLYTIFSPSGIPLYEKTESGQGTPVMGDAHYLVVNKDRSAYAMEGLNDAAMVVKYAPLPLPAEVHVSDAMTKEPDSGQGEMTFSFQLSKALDYDINLNFHTVDGNAIAGVDYLPVQGKLTIPAHSQGASIQVPILSDNIVEPSKFFYLTISEPPNGTFYARSIATGKIVDSNAFQISLPLLLQN